MSELYSCEQVAQRYGVKVITVWDWIRRKQLPAMKIGKLYRISEADLMEFEASRKTTT